MTAFSASKFSFSDRFCTFPFGERNVPVSAPFPPPIPSPSILPSWLLLFAFPLRLPLPPHTIPILPSTHFGVHHSAAVSGFLTVDAFCRRTHYVPSSSQASITGFIDMKKIVKSNAPNTKNAGLYLGRRTAKKKWRDSVV